MPLQGVDRTLDVLETLAVKPATLAEVARATGLAKSVTHRILASLVVRGYAVNDGGRYRLGLRVARLAAAGLADTDVRTGSRPALERLARATDETVHLMVLEDDAVVYLDKVESSHTVRMASRIGMRGLVHCTACGKAILAWLPVQEARATVTRADLPARTPRTITDVETLMTALEQVRRRGYALDDEENEPDVRCVAMPVLDADGRPVAAVSVSAPAYRLPRRRVPAIAAQIRIAIGEIAAATATRLGAQ